MNEGILVVSIFAVIFLFPAVVAKLERRKTWPYSKQYDFGDFQLSSEDQFFIEQCTSSAQKEGFSYLEKRYDGKGKRYKVVYEFLISKDFNTLSIIGAGTVMSMPVKGMWFFSKDVGNIRFHPLQQPPISCSRDWTSRQTSIIA